MGNWSAGVPLNSKLATNVCACWRLLPRHNPGDNPLLLISALLLRMRRRIGIDNFSALRYSRPMRLSGRKSSAHTQQRRERRPTVLLGLIAAMAAFFVAQVFVEWWEPGFVRMYLGITDQGVRDAYAWQFVAAPLLHTSPWHFLANVFVLYLLGRDLESILGQRHFLYLFVAGAIAGRSEEHTSELQSQSNLVCRLLLEMIASRSQDAPGFFFFNDTATTEIYTLSLHDALPILPGSSSPHRCCIPVRGIFSPMYSSFICWDAIWNRFSASAIFSICLSPGRSRADRKSTRLNSSHSQISYAVFCLK